MMAHTKVRVTITISPAVLEAGKKTAGLIPFSRWTESVLLKEIDLRKGEGTRE